MKSQLGERWGRWVVSHPWKAIAIGVLAVMVSAAGAKDVFMNSQYRYFFGRDNPQLQEFDKLQKVYAKEDSVLIAIEPKSGNVFSKDTLKVVEAVTEWSWQTPFSSRVDSITNFQHTRAEGDDLIVERLVPDAASLTSTDLARVRAAAISEPNLAGRLVTEKGDITAVNISVNVPGKDPLEVPEIAAYARGIAERVEREFPGHSVHLSGLLMLNNAFFEAGLNDMMALTPLMYLAILIVMIALLRSVSGVIATLSVVLLSMAAGMGFAGWAGIPISPPSAIAPTVILTLAIADCVHILVTAFSLMGQGVSKKDALVESIRVNLQPVVLTSLTTVIGFLSLNASDSPPYHDLGNITAVGVVFALLLAITVLPGAMMLLPMRTRRASKGATTMFEGLAGFVSRRRVAVALIIGLGAVALMSRIPQLQVNDQFVQYFDRSMEFRRDTDRVIEKLTGVYQIQYDIRSEGPQGVTDPAYLAHLEEFSAFLREEPQVRHVSTFTDVMKRVNKSMNGDDPQYYRLPEQRDLAAQYLLLYEMSLPFGLDLNNQVDIDKSSTRLVATLNDVSTADMLALADRGDRWLAQHTPKEMHGVAAGPSIMFSHITERNIEGMIRGSAVALILITLIMIISLRSVRYGLLSIIPNVIPAGMAFGAWYFLRGEVGFAVSVVMSVTLGLIVDDTVHFLSKYVRVRREGEGNTTEAIKYVMSNVGSALTITSVVLALGFLVMTLSAFKLNVTLGALSALTIVIALGTDLLLLPAILLLVDRSQDSGQAGKPRTRSLAAAALVLLTLGAATANADDGAAAKGLDIAKKVDRVNNGFKDETVQASMVLRNQHGQETTRLLNIKTLEVADDGDKSLVTFKNPRDIKGTSFLSFTHKAGNDDQWLFLPAVRRVKRISSNNKSGPFVGSEFAYEDISSQEVEKYTYLFIRDDSLGGKSVHVIDRFPVDKNSGYVRQRVYVDSSEYIPLKIEYFDRKKSHLKTLELAEYKKHKNRHWRPHRMTMVNHQNGKSTLLLRDSFSFESGLTDRDFDKSALKRAR